MVFNFQIGAFCNLDLILHKVEQKNPTNYPLQILRILHFTLHSAKKNPQIARCRFSAFYHHRLETV